MPVAHLVLLFQQGHALHVLALARIVQIGKPVIDGLPVLFLDGREIRRRPFGFSAVMKSCLGGERACCAGCGCGGRGPNMATAPCLRWAATRILPRSLWCSRPRR
jgi:hypothetical protein